MAVLFPGTIRLLKVADDEEEEGLNEIRPRFEEEEDI
jgi:hypothetical protein